MIFRRVGYACWLLAAATLYFFENNTGTRAVLLASVIVPAFSVCCAAWTAKKASCRLTVPESAKKGETAACRCDLSGPWTKIGCVLSCRVRSEHLMNHEISTWEIEGKECFAVRNAHCGTLYISAKALTARDWLGLIRFSCKAFDGVSLLVLPDLYPIRIKRNAMLSEPQREELPGQLRRDGLETENGGVREYAPGDPVRRIHWKLSAKTDRVLVREEEQPLAGSVLLLLETSGYGIDPQDMDGAVEALLSVSRALREEGVAHSISWLDRGGLEWIDIACMNDYLAMRALLSAQGLEGEESIGTAFSRAYPDFRADHAVVFSPRPDTDCISLREIGAVTLVLPHSKDGNPDLRVVNVSREEPELEL
ncbi:MAG: DUF58 domain-containing protein [Clostridia bacterium]|nr:DUF58 domain-containing protein [Clostridia bacterium]MBQ6961379.1 DUF58 domain-containing protein [Clostridia bacterium]